MGKGVLVRKEEHVTKKKFRVEKNGAEEGTLETEVFKGLDG